MTPICVAASLTTVRPLIRPGRRRCRQVSNESPALSPEAEMKTFFLPPGYHVELVASEPMVEDPILIDWDPTAACG